MAAFRQRPILVEAVQYGTRLTAATRIGPSNELRRFLKAGGSGLITCPGGIMILSLQGDRFAHPGDWIVKGVDGEFRPIEPDLFEISHQPLYEQGPSEDAKALVAPVREG